MRFPQFFIGRPIFAAVLSAIILVAGLVALPNLPTSEYPNVVPPTIVVRASYPGANPKVIAETVASPLEQAVNGVEGMLYMSSQSTADGAMALTVTFRQGTDPDKAQVQVQNRVAQALPRLPQDVQRLGVTTTKASPELTIIVFLRSPDGRYDMLHLSNYALLRVRDQLARIEGIGEVQLFGLGAYSMRVWLNPDKLAARGLTPGDVASAIRAQNAQVVGGRLGGEPNDGSAAFQLTVNTHGRLEDEREFENIVVRAGPEGQLVRLRDVARVELGAESYGLRSLLNNKPTVGLTVYQQPGANTLAIADGVRATMAELSNDFPQGMEYSVVYDPTVFVRASIDAVIHTLIEAIVLVVLVVVLFLQTWRASLIPLIAVPVSLVGTLAAMWGLGFSINTLTLFGMVLAVGIVVDDAIVVVENVERNIALGLPPRDATRQAMREVTGPIISTALVLCAVFVPTAFISGLTGLFFQQFALTITVSTLISAFNSLTLSPALCAVLLKSHDAPKDRLTRTIDRSLGWLFRPFNCAFDRGSHGYVRGVGATLRRRGAMLALYAGLVALGVFAFNTVPAGFVPAQDKQFLAAIVQLPDGATLDRTEAVARRVSEIMMEQPGVAHAVAFPGLSPNGFSTSPNVAIVSANLEDFDKRRSPELSANAIQAALQAKVAGIQEAQIGVFPPAPVQGLGFVGGFKMQVEDRKGLGLEELYRQTQNLIAKGSATPGLAGLFSGYQVNVPQVQADIDRAKAFSHGVDMAEASQTLQAYLGSLYVNDFNRFGRTYQVNIQADARFRQEPSDIRRLETRNGAGEMVPLGAFVTVSAISGPDRVMHYNGYPTAEINGGPAPGYSSGQAEALMEQLARAELPEGMTFEWTDLTYQRIIAGNTAVFIFPLCVFLAFLVLAAQYESWSLPLVVVLTVPTCLVSAIAGVWLTGGDNNIFTQIALVVLVGLACKNAILIVEFARDHELAGASVKDAVLEACRLRLRPILMTSLAFIMGVVPLALSEGAGAEIRRALGVAVLSGMIGVTLFGLLLTPVFYLVVRSLVGKPLTGHAPASPQALGAAE